jgi:hypothetical protein
MAIAREIASKQRYLLRLRLVVNGINRKGIKINPLLKQLLSSSVIWDSRVK